MRSGVHQGKYTSPHVGAADLRVFHGQDQTLGNPNVRSVKELHTFYEFTVKIAIDHFNRIRDGNPVTESQSKIERICSRGFLCGGAPSKSPKSDRSFFGASSSSHLASVAFHARFFLASFSAFVSNLPSTLSSSFGAYLGLPP